MRGIKKDEGEEQKGTRRGKRGIDEQRREEWKGEGIMEK